MQLFEFDKQYGDVLLCGVDEAGRGPLAGPVVAAAVILKSDANILIPDVNDSKKFSEKKREELYERVLKSALSIGVSEVSAQKIDEINILNATMLAMKKAVENLSIKPNIVIVDGNRLPDIEIKSESIVKGDSKSASIAAASIVAKVRRDNIMKQLSKKYSNYFFDKNKGYGTKQHYESILKYGIICEHRKTFLKKMEDKRLKIQNLHGMVGEKISYCWLKKNGFEVICKNYKSKFGEIDLIATKGKFIYYIEVKLRKKNCGYFPKELVDLKKQKKIIKTAIIFNQNHPNKYQPKFAVIEIIMKESAEFELNFLDDAFIVEDESSIFLN